MLINRVLKNAPQREGINTATVLLVSNIAEYYYIPNKKEYWNLSVDYPNIAPPWPNIWFEWIVPRYLNSEVHGFIENPVRKNGVRVGLFFSFKELTDNMKPHPGMFDQLIKGVMAQKYLQMCGGDYNKSVYDAIRKRVNYEHELIKKHDPEFLKMAQEKIYGFCSEALSAQMVSRGLKWTFGARVFLETYKGNLLEVPTSMHGFVSGEGRFVGIKGNGADITVVPDDFIDPTKTQEFADSITSYLHVPFLALSFIHCKNVSGIEHSLPRKRSSKKDNGLAAHKYYVLNIDPMKKVLGEKGNAADSGLKRAMHICRGHFATYTEDAPLFGRYAGTFWKPMHIKGNASKGIVEKDYSVNPGEFLS